MLTTWEAVEHAGPGQYDEDYLDYFAEICRAAGDHGFYVFIDFHQDVWSRMTGGSGAPGWTLAAAGLDFTKFDAADAAQVMQHRYDPAIGGRQATYPPMNWAANYQAPANGIMWTLFWAGNAFAPNHVFDGVPVQAFLQNHYLGAMRAVAERVKLMTHVIGFDTLNEPGRGWIGKHLELRPAKTRGLKWNVLDALSAASGFSRSVPIDDPDSQSKCVVVNARRVSIWRGGAEDPFRAAGVWDVNRAGEPVALLPEHFIHHSGRPAILESDFIAPFFHRVAETIRSIREDWLVFAEISPHAVIGSTQFPGDMPVRSVNALHWYDYTALVNKSFSTERTVDIRSGEVRVGRQATRNHYVDQLSHIKRFGDLLPGGAPTLIGEFGIPYDLDDCASFERFAAGARGDEIWSAQTEALELMYEVFDELLISSTQWNYTASNCNDAMIGDGWNQEDLSIFSEDQRIDPGNPDSGGRAIDGFCRPYVRAAQGALMRQYYDRARRRFEFDIDADLSIEAPSEVYAPIRIFGASPVMRSDDADFEWIASRQIFLLRARRRGRISATIVGESEALETAVATGDARRADVMAVNNPTRVR